MGPNNTVDQDTGSLKTVGFTGQLRGWWDNYMSIEKQPAVINAIADNKGVDNLGMSLLKNREEAVYTLVLTILEHFNGRLTNQYETVRTLLNGLRCRTLGEFRSYKDTYMSRVMEFSVNNYEHWKAKFIDGLPPLFAERVRKTLRNDRGEIPYKDYTYDSEEEVDLLYISDSNQHDKMNICNSCQGDICSCENDEFYKLQSQFQDLNINTITSDNVIELLKEVTDNDLREKIIHLASNNASSSSSKNSEKQKNDVESEYAAPYSLSEINNRLNKQTTPTRDSSFDDLKNEIKSLKRDQMICDHKLTHRNC
ncbi:uncharacterized protein LOC125824229 [Solanum verrucosum]|uniref:uncharacterized protein LOC125824229 n=1 Tax=Solanum verrucosum TaxID=315347 RepID=UPI0020D16A81|nr:uncharacterized protein LOC125824229 [Solanum verrucosum]